MPEIDFKEFTVLKYKWPNGKWIDIDIIDDYYLFDCSELDEEIVFKTEDALLDYLELNGLLGILTIKESDENNREID